MLNDVCSISSSMKPTTEPAAELLLITDVQTNHYFKSKIMLLHIQNFCGAQNYLQEVGLA